MRNVQLAYLEHLFYNLRMNALDTLIELSSQMNLEHAEDSVDGRVGRGDSQDRIAKSPQGETTPSCYSPKEQSVAFVHPAQLPNGKKIKLLKTLLSYARERDRYYCPFRAGRDFRRATFKPD
ncbi:MAG: hypothetical protein JETCAE01_22940 [Anaerolineaceae bacterium]|nr:MAG: hypothetical protein JETCAE01_22940 [Anaerolineaceae bacterium]